MTDHLQEGIVGISSFDRYKAELLSGTLTWVREGVCVSSGWVGGGLGGWVGGGGVGAAPL